MFWGHCSNGIAHFFFFRLIDDGAHYSLSSDDPILTGSMLSGEYAFITEKMEVSLRDIQKAVSEPTIATKNEFILYCIPS